MTAKEKNEHLVSKWNFMLESLDNHKTNRVTYAKVFEATAMNSNSNTIKLVLPFLQRLFFTLPDLKFSATSKHSMLIGATDRDLVIDGWSIMPDGAAKFISDLITSTVDKFKSGDLEKIAYVRLTETMGQIQISAYY